MRAIDLSNLTWRKSSYSNSDGGECVEVSDDLLASVQWCKSSYSNTSGGDCVEVSDDLLAAASWHKSSYSNSDGGNCLEVAAGIPSLVPVRDSKAPAHGTLLFTASSWSVFVAAVKTDGV
ncbi:DUF397 domain-containing protein [Streptomyces fuscichromogenes]|uniref:DUF397 domain-containing protein n=1 Tax=Streptomyces fuscichromogenes TaxID=1324013 RepID=A0A918CU36_9ACTN|nr:DUF397 domain-containing protein [Streptomyces fuscichromogenes]GGN25619.1 hypothetical protein GCM10011578_059690 [Streptomyces fuscichromogenes]